MLESHTHTQMEIGAYGPRAAKRRLPPGPRGLPLVGVAPFLAREPYRYLPSLAKRYGDVVHVPVPRTTLILVSHTDHVRRVMNNPGVYMNKPAMMRDAVTEMPLFPPTFVVLDGEEWRRRRRALNPRFTARGLAELSDVMAEGIREEVDGWSTHADTGEVVDLQHELHVLTMSVLLRSMFTMRPERALVVRAVDEFNASMHSMGWRMMLGNIASWVPRPHARRGRAASAWIARYLDDMVRERRERPQETPDLLNALLDARFEDGTGFADDDLRTELRSLTVGGYETTAAALAWTLAFLGITPTARERAYAEVDALGGREIRGADAEVFTWLRASFDEAQRLQGIPLTAREAIADDEIEGWHIPKGATVGISVYGMQRDPRFWRDPETFDPSRFIEEEVDKYAFLPFGVGPHRCLGVRMAYVIGPLTLATALQRYRFELPAGYQPEHRFSLGNPVGNGLPVTLHRRR